jgi:hypothetical protein
MGWVGGIGERHMVLQSATATCYLPNCSPAASGSALAGERPSSICNRQSAICNACRWAVMSNRRARAGSPVLPICNRQSAICNTSWDVPKLLETRCLSLVPPPVQSGVPEILWGIASEVISAANLGENREANSGATSGLTSGLTRPVSSPVTRQVHPQVGLEITSEILCGITSGFASEMTPETTNEFVPSTMYEATVSVTSSTT